MNRNNFQKLEEKEIFLEPFQQELIRRRIHGRISLFRMVGQMADLYVPNFFLSFSDLLDVHKSQSINRFPNPPKFKN